MLKTSGRAAYRNVSAGGWASGVAIIISKSEGWEESVVIGQSLKIAALLDFNRMELTEFLLALAMGPLIIPGHTAESNRPDSSPGQHSKLLAVSF